MNPEQPPFNPQQPVFPVNNQSPQGMANTSKQKPPKALVIALAGSVLLLFMAVILIVVLAAGDKTAPVQQQPKTDSTELTPADAINIEAINNSISQDISTLNDGEDFPAEKLNDKNLGL